MAERRVSFIIGSNAAALYSGLNKVQKRMEGWANQMQRKGQSMSQKITAPLLGIGAFAVKNAADLETMTVGFESMLGSGDKALNMMKDLTSFTAKTPFQLDDVGSATKSLLAFGTQAEETIPTLKFLGDISAGANVPLGEMAQIYGKIQTKGKAMTEELLQLSERGIPIIDVLAKKFGVAKDEVFEMASRSQIDFNTVREALKGLTQEGGIFEDQMKKQSETLKGLFSTLKDNITLSLGEIGESLVKTFSIKKLMSGAIIAIDKMKNKWIALSEETKKRVLLMAALFAASGPLLIAFGVVIKAVVLLSKVFTSKFFMITALFGSVVVAGQWFVDNWTKISLGIENVTISIGSAFYQMGLSIMKAIREVIQFIIRKIPPVALAKLFGIDVDDWATEVIGIDSTIAKMEATISNGQQALKKGINKYNEIDFTSIGESAQNALKKIKESIEQLFGIRFDQLGAQALNSWNNFVDGLVAGSELSSEALKKARILEFGEGIGKKNLSLDLTPKMDLTKMYVQVPAFIEKTKEMSNAMMIATDIGNTFTNSFGQGMANIIVQGERVIDVFKNIGRLLASSVIQKGLSILLTGGLAGDGLFGSGGGILGRLFSGLGFATGGIPPVGKASIVGERGPELFIPGVRGTIIPNHQIGGSSGAGVGMLLPISINLNERVLYNALVKVQQKINK